MRTIKFRGKCIKSGDWVYGDLIHGVGSKSERMYILPRLVNLAYVKHCDPLDGVEVRPETIGQFTGLLDKDGKEIYEGDIRKDRRYNGTPGDFMRFIGKVEYRHGKFVLTGVKKYEGLHADLFGTGTNLGNIHDNPELL